MWDATYGDLTRLAVAHALLAVLDRLDPQPSPVVTAMQPAFDPPADPQRAEVIAGIRAMADWLEKHPEAPLLEHTSRASIQYAVPGTPDEQRAEWQRLVGLWGATVRNWSREGHLAATVAFGNAEYDIVAIWTPEPAAASDVEPVAEPASGMANALGLDTEGTQGEPVNQVWECPYKCGLHIAGVQHFDETEPDPIIEHLAEHADRGDQLPAGTVLTVNVEGTIGTASVPQARVWTRYQSGTASNDRVERPVMPVVEQISQPDPLLAVYPDMGKRINPADAERPQVADDTAGARADVEAVASAALAPDAVQIGDRVQCSCHRVGEMRWGVVKRIPDDHDRIVIVCDEDGLERAYARNEILTVERPSTVDADAAQILAATRPDQPADIPGTLQAFANMARRASEEEDE